MSLVDRFLDRMAVKPKHMACMSVASFHLAIKQLDLKPIPAEDLVTISQVGVWEISPDFAAYLLFFHMLLVWLYRWRSGTHGRCDCQQAGRPDGTCTDHLRELPAHLLRPLPQPGEGDRRRLLQVLPAADQVGGAGEPAGDPDVRRQDHGDHALDAGAGAHLPAPGLPHQGVVHPRQSRAEARL